MVQGLVSKVKSAFAKKPPQVASPQTAAPSKQKDIGQSMSFEEATSFLAPDGPMDRQLRPPPLAKGGAQGGGAQKKAPDSVDLAVGVAKGLAASAAQKKDPAVKVDAAKQGGPRAPVAATYTSPHATKAQAPGPATYVSANAKKADPQAPGPATYTSPTATNAQAPGPATDVGAPAKLTAVYLDDQPAQQRAPARAEAPRGSAKAAPSEPAEYWNDAPQSQRAPAPQAQPAEQPLSAMERGSESAVAQAQAEALLSAEEEQQIAEAAVTLPQEEADPLAAQRKAAAHDTGHYTRIGLSPAEKKAKGWVLMPMRLAEMGMDERGSENGGFDTVYHYDDEQDLQRNKGGAKQTTNRKDHIVEIRDGKFMLAKSGELLDTKDAAIPGFLVAERAKKRAAERGKATLDDHEKDELRQELRAEGGRYIFVMNATGQIFAGPSIFAVQHHSSFLGGGAVAAAGELVLGGGQLSLISNMSGHYQSGPGFLWQALWTMREQGVPLGGVKAELFGVGTIDAEWFMAEFDPMQHPELMANTEALHYLREKLAARKQREEAQAAQAANHNGPESKQENTYV